MQVIACSIRMRIKDIMLDFSTLLKVNPLGALLALAPVRPAIYFRF
jgi:hypothetical protein